LAPLEQKNKTGSTYNRDSQPPFYTDRSSDSFLAIKSNLHSLEDSAYEPRLRVVSLGEASTFSSESGNSSTLNDDEHEDSLTCMSTKQILVNVQSDKIECRIMQLSKNEHGVTETPTDQIDVTAGTVVQNKRETEVCRVEKHILQLYVTSNENKICIDLDKASTLSNRTETRRGGFKLLKANSSKVSFREYFAKYRPVSRTGNSFSVAKHGSPSSVINGSICKRKKTRLGNLCDFEQWRDTCQHAKRVDDESLPSLEEAACLFGYSTMV